MMSRILSGCRIFSIILLTFFFTFESQALFTSAKATVKVVSEDGIPIGGANVGIGFEKNTGWATEMSGQQGFSSDKGTFTATGNCNGHITYGADLEGYYDSYHTYDFQEKSTFGWKPWNPDLEVVLRKIENPVPMYARDTVKSVIEIPVIGQDVGFDLVAFDWVAPHGSGAQADLVFHLKRRVVNRMDYDATLTVMFSNHYDGIQIHREELSEGSVFKFPRNAPERGYKDKLVLKQWRKPDDYSVKRNFDFLAKDMNYFFRIRSEEVDGKLERAMYGKILGHIGLTAIFSETAEIYFKYYLNPDYTRNLEFDPDQNLFKNLPDREQVGIK